jgi:hypothetical protein
LTAPQAAAAGARVAARASAGKALAFADNRGSLAVRRMIAAGKSGEETAMALVRLAVGHGKRSRVTPEITKASTDGEHAGTWLAHALTAAEARRRLVGEGKLGR